MCSNYTNPVAYFVFVVLITCYYWTLYINIFHRISKMINSAKISHIFEHVQKIQILNVA